jgi:hypothetical protein
VHLEQDAVLCPECDALWLPGDALAAGTFHDYGTYMMERGRREPEGDGELFLRGPLVAAQPGA